jgi:hypothetical protein
MSVAGIAPTLARHIVQRMGETGQPPERGALIANVGTQPILDVLREEYLLPMRETGRNSSFKLVQAPFGGGKTHFLHCLREVAWAEGFATSMVGISPEQCPFDDSEAIYREVVRNIQLPPESMEETPQPGIDALLRFVLERKTEMNARDSVRAWLDSELPRVRVDSPAVLRAAQKFMVAVLDGDEAVADLMAAYLRGEKVAPAELLTHRIRELLDGAQAFRFLRSLTQLLRSLDVPGVVLLFDEMDRVMSLSVRRRRAIGDNLRQMIDHCGQSSLPSVLWVYAVPPEFMTTIVPEYPALEQRLKGAATFSLTSPLAPIIDLDQIPLGTVELLKRIGERLADLYAVAHGWTFDAAVQRDNIDRLACALGASQLESGTRRTYVKAAVQMLTAQHRGEQKRLTDAEVHKLTDRGAPPLAELDGEEEFA